MQIHKYLLTRIGGRIPERAIYNFSASVNFLAVGRWMRAHGYRPRRSVSSREQLFDLLGQTVADRHVLYLEFGVAQGAATRYWCKLLRNPRSHLHGFDSFQGLPEDWILDRARGHFDTGGFPPVIDDPRAQFFRGWFHDTLPRYEPPPHDVLVVISDADLYSSTTFVLNHLEKMIVPGSYLYFDEFQHREHELKAFDEFIRRTGMKFSLVGATHPFSEVVFQRIE